MGGRACKAGKSLREAGVAFQPLEEPFRMTASEIPREEMDTGLGSRRRLELIEDLRCTRTMNSQPEEMNDSDLLRRAEEFVGLCGDNRWGLPREKDIIIVRITIKTQQTASKWPRGDTRPSWARQLSSTYPKLRSLSTRIPVLLHGSNYDTPIRFRPRQLKPCEFHVCKNNATH